MPGSEKNPFQSKCQETIETLRGYKVVDPWRVHVRPRKHVPHGIFYLSLRLDKTLKQYLEQPHAQTFVPNLVKAALKLWCSMKCMQMERFTDLDKECFSRPYLWVALAVHASDIESSPRSSRRHAWRPLWSMVDNYNPQVTWLKDFVDLVFSWQFKSQ